MITTANLDGLELLPCPFCNAYATRTFWATGAYVRCSSEHPCCVVERGSLAEAVAAWQTRSPVTRIKENISGQQVTDSRTHELMDTLKELNRVHDLLLESIAREAVMVRVLGHIDSHCLGSDNFPFSYEEAKMITTAIDNASPKALVLLKVLAAAKPLPGFEGPAHEHGRLLNVLRKAISDFEQLDCP